MEIGLKWFGSQKVKAATGVELGSGDGLRLVQTACLSMICRLVFVGKDTICCLRLPSQFYDLTFGNSFCGIEAVVGIPQRIGQESVCQLNKNPRGVNSMGLAF